MKTHAHAFGLALISSASGGQPGGAFGSDLISSASGGHLGPSESWDISAASSFCVSVAAAAFASKPVASKLLLYCADCVCILYDLTCCARKTRPKAISVSRNTSPGLPSI